MALFRLIRNFFLILFVLFLVGCVDSEPVDQMNRDVLLEDVTDGNDVRGINTNGSASGQADAYFVDGEYSLAVILEDLPDPNGTDFYEGWIVRKGISFSVISTGKLVKKNSIYFNEFSSMDDLTDHDFYVLTIEPDDGDPAPADHVLEGKIN